MKNIWLVALLISVSGCTRRRSDSAISSEEQFVVKYIDSRNLGWGGDVGAATNGCVDDNDRRDESRCSFDEKGQIKLEDSRAAQLCSKYDNSQHIHRLPSRDDFENLIREFDHVVEDERLMLTTQGVSEFQTVFGVTDTQASLKYWTSSLYMTEFNNGDASQVNAGYTFSYDRVDHYYWNRLMPHIRVRCVIEAANKSKD